MHYPLSDAVGDHGDVRFTHYSLAIAMHKDKPERKRYSDVNGTLSHTVQL